MRKALYFAYKRVSVRFAPFHELIDSIAKVSAGYRMGDPVAFTFYGGQTRERPLLVKVNDSQKAKAARCRIGEIQSPIIRF